MAAFQYCTPEWLDDCEKTFKSDPKYADKFKKITGGVLFRVKAEPEWGIDKDIIFGAELDAGKLLSIGFYSKEDAKKKATFLLSATPQEWKKILSKESKFVADFMLGKIKLDQGSQVGVLKLAPVSGDFVNLLTVNGIQFPDEMSPDELAKYRSNMEKFRSKLGV